MHLCMGNDPALHAERFLQGKREDSADWWVGTRCACLHELSVQRKIGTLVPSPLITFCLRKVTVRALMNRSTRRPVFACPPLIRPVLGLLLVHMSNRRALLSRFGRMDCPAPDRLSDVVEQSTVRSTLHMQSICHLLPVGLMRRLRNLVSQRL